MIETDKILAMTNGGLDIFVHYFGEVCKQKLFRNPFRSDSSPSCHLYYRDSRTGGTGRYYLKDFGASEWCGDCFWFVAKVENINQGTDFISVLRAIDHEMGLYIFDTDNSFVHRPMPKVQTPVKLETSHPYKFFPKYRHFNRHELEYWASYGIGRDILERYNVRSLTSCRFEHGEEKEFTLQSSLENPMYGYTFNNGEGIKTYRPKSKYRFIYAGNLPKPYIFGWEQLPPTGDRVYITGGEKDVLSLAAAGFNAISLNSETAKLPSNILSELLSRFHHIIFVYDTDSTGLSESALRVTESNQPGRVHRVILPLSGTKQEKDVSDYFRKGFHATDLVYQTTEIINKTKP